MEGTKTPTRTQILQGVRGVNSDMLNKILVDAIQNKSLATDAKLHPDGRLLDRGHYICLPKNSKALAAKLKGTPTPREEG